MHRLINLADGDQLRLLNIADQNTDITYTGDAFNNLRNEVAALRSIGGTGKNKVLNTASASRKIAELTMRAAPPDADSYAIIGAYEAAGDSFKQGRTPAQWFSNTWRGP